MNQRDINIDDIVDYKTEYSIIKKAKPSGEDSIVGLCPFHNDSEHSSFSVNLKTGKWFCFAENEGGNFIDFYARINGITTKEAYKKILEKYNVPLKDEPKKDKKSGLASYSLQQYSFEKKLPEDFLKNDCHITTEKDYYQKNNYMKIPYYLEDGTEIVFRKRYGNKEFRWQKGSKGKIPLYGEWRLPAIKEVGYVVLVEGESDTQSMWYMLFPCLGVPGAAMFKKEMAEKLKGLKIYLHKEPDQGGNTFIRKVTEVLRKAGIEENVFVFSCNGIDKHKDPSEVFMAFGREEARKRIQEAITYAEKIDFSKLDIIPEVIKDAPVNLREPENWKFSEDGIFIIDEKTLMPILVCRTPILITRRLKNLELGEEKIEIAFLRDKQWNKYIYPRSTIFSSRSITTLSDVGCTITSENAKSVVKFLGALEAENIDILTMEESTSSFGWQHGNRFIPGHGTGLVMDIDPSQRGMAAAYCQQGNLEDWIKLMAPHRERDKFRFILAAGFAAPLLKILKQRIYFVYNWGGSKGGKTAALKAALSAWGDPERLMVNFNATQVGLERTAAFYRDLPLGIDERQLAGKNQGMLEKIVYMISSGTGKIRGNKTGGLQTTSQWRTIAISTGEEPLSTGKTQTGVSSRVIELYGGPFNDEKSASLMHQQAADNCGWAGPLFIEYLLQVNWDDIRKKYDEMMSYLNENANGRSISHIAGVAIVALADAMIDTWIFCKQSPKNKEFVILEESWIKAKRLAQVIAWEQETAESSDVNENATQYIVDWILSNKNYFGEDVEGKCYGLIKNDKVYIFRTILDEVLEKAEYSPKKTMKFLVENGLIGTSKNGNKIQYTVTQRFNGKVTRFVEFHISKYLGNENPMDNWEAVGQEKLPFD